jgi:glycosyltransferase involved in cell wall biosynthesis
MKILHIGKYFSPFKGGVESYLRDVMVTLAEQGVESAAIVHQHEKKVSSTDESFEMSGSRFRVTRAGVLFNLSFTPVSPYFPVLLKRLLKSFRPDILHIHMPNPSALWALASKPARRIPWVVHWHSDVIASSLPVKFFYALYRPFEQLILQRSAAIVATSEAYRASSESLLKFSEKCRVIPLGIDPRRYTPTTADDVKSPHTAGTNKELQVLAIGRLTYYKGFNFLLEAMALAKSARLVIVGTGAEENNLKALADKLKLGNRISFHGALSDQEMIRQISLCDCVCLPSIERTEAFGIVLLEAMQRGKATLISDVPGSGMGWIVDDGVTGIKVPPADAVSLARAMDYLAENHEALINMGQQGKQKFDQQFDINLSIEKLIDLYREMPVRPERE